MADLRSVLQEHYDNFGSLKDEDLVKEAKKASHPLHASFEWNDKIAGHEYRCLQARRLIKTVPLRFLTPEGEARSVRYWLSDYESGGSEAEGGTYSPATEVMADPLRAEIELKACKRAIAALKQRYGYLEEFTSLVQQGLLEEEN